MIRINNIHLIDKYIDTVDDVLIVGDKIECIGRDKIEQKLIENNTDEIKIIDGSGKYLSPSFVDLHFHLRNPGQEYKQTFEEASAASIRGGYTKVVAMANTKPIADNTEVLDAVQEGMKNLPLEVIQCGAVTMGLKGEELVDFAKLREKTFIFSDDGRNVDSADIMEEALRLSLVHDFIIMDHDEPESEMVIRNIELARKTGGRLHFCHISEKKSIDAILKAKEDKLNITYEVSPHHIYSKNNDYRVNPPIGTDEDNEAILYVVKNNLVDTIATDHAPHTEEDKQKGAPGICNIETAFGMVRKVFAAENISLRQQIALMSNNPSELLGVDNRIVEGNRADLVIFSDRESSIDKETFATRSKNTPFDGQPIRGVIEYTIAGGVLYDHERA